MSSSNNSERTGSESLYPDSIHVRCAKGTTDRVHRVARASLTSAPEWLRRVIIDALNRKDGGDPPSPLAPSAGTLARMHGEDTSGGRAFPEHVRVSCPPETNKLVTKAAKNRGTSRSEWVRRVLAHALAVHLDKPQVRNLRSPQRGD